MSLLVWLPLTGDLHNLGLSGEIPSLMGNGITYTDGKIGLAATFPNSCNSCIYMTGLKLQTGTWGAWIKVLGEGAGTSLRIISEGRDTGSVGTNIWVNKAGTNLTVHTHKKSLATTINLDEWVHIILSFGEGIIKLYKNGQMITSTTYTEDTDYALSNDKLVLGKMSYSYTSTSNYFPFNGLLNDVRIYDHVLSDKEVEEIAKGLVLHYKLDNNGLGGENLFTNTNLGASHWTLSYGDGAGSLSSDGIAAKYTITTLATNWLVFGFRPSNNTNVMSILSNSGKVYTLSFDIYATSAFSVNPSYRDGNASNNLITWPTLNTIANQWVHYEGTATTIGGTISNQEIYINYKVPVGTYIFKNLKVEEGSIATPWSPNPADLDIDSSIIYDCSGYGNDGIITGTLETITSNVRYNCATLFDNKEYITHKLPENMYYATYSFWVKASSYTSYGAIYMPYLSPSAGTSPWFAINTESCKVWAYFGNNSPNYTKGSGTMSLNEWHHCVYVWNNGIALWYVDGEKNGNSVTYTTRTYIQNTANATIGNSYTGTSWNGTPFSGQISDFRVYATALTAEQIKELYHTSASVDNNGNIYARELVEV